jgi:hypothetical protein
MESLPSADIEVSSWSASECSSVSSWSTSDAESETQQVQPLTATCAETLSEHLTRIVDMACPCKKHDHYHPFRDASSSFVHLSKLRFELQHVMTAYERRVQLFNLAKIGNEIAGHCLCFRGYCKLLGVSQKLICRLRAAPFAPPVDERFLVGIRAPPATPVADVVTSFLIHAHAVYAEDMANVVGWGVHDVGNIPQSKWKFITDCVLSPESELQMSDASGPAALVCRQDAKVLPPMTALDLSFSCTTSILTILDLFHIL